MYAFINKCWTHEVDVMREKNQDVRKIHQLRIIGMLEASFNRTLKILFTKKAMSYTEWWGNLHYD